MSRILAIETSCDETAIAILEATWENEQPRFTTLSHQLYSQAKIHAEFGGVFPQVAKREHIKIIIPLLVAALKETSLDENGSTEFDQAALEALLEREAEAQPLLIDYLKNHSVPKIDAVAVTQGPGLEPALWVGVNIAKALAIVWHKPLIPVNHMLGHFYSTLAQAENKLDFPALGLLVSGGHTELLLAESWDAFTLVGSTRDDAVGEAYDKVARLFDLPYPGGPRLAALAERARTDGLTSAVKLPRPMLDSDDFDFSYSGLKTAVLYTLKEKSLETEHEQAAFAREFEEAVADTLTHKTKKAIERFVPKSLVAAGGVMANTYLRTRLQTLADEFELALLLPPAELATDNAVMIALAAHVLLHTESPDIKRTPADIAEVRASSSFKY